MIRYKLFADACTLPGFCQFACIGKGSSFVDIVLFAKGCSHIGKGEIGTADSFPHKAGAFV